MKLQKRCRQVCRNRAAQRTFHAMGFPRTYRHENEPAGLQDGSHSHRQRFARDPRWVAVKQCGVVATCRFGETHPMSSCGQFVAGLVEPDMTVAADTEKLEIDSAGSLDCRFVPLTFSVEVFGIPVQEMYVRWRQIHIREQMAVHERAEAARMCRWDACELVEVESDGAFEIHAAPRVELTQLLVDSNRSAPRRQAEHQRW